MDNIKDKIRRYRQKHRNKTIFMPRTKLSAWLAALRSGKYKQGYHTLYDRDTKGYCCLGVMQKRIGGKVEMFSDGISYGAPTPEWLEANDVYFCHAFTADPLTTGARIPYLPRARATAAEANDTRRMPFEELADYIESAAVALEDLTP